MMNDKNLLKEFRDTIEANEMLIFLIGFSIMVFDIMFLDSIPDFLHFLLISSFFYFLRFKNVLQSILVFALLIMIPSAALLGKMGPAEKGAIWLFYFFVYQVMRKVIVIGRSEEKDI